MPTLFDILACGGFVLAEHSSDLEQLFEVGRDLDTWKTVEELAQKVCFYRAHPDQAEQMAQHGLQTVRRHHSIAARVRRMLESVDSARRRTG